MTYKSYISLENDAETICKYMAINLQLVINAQIEFMTNAKQGMSKNQLKQIGIDLLTKRGIPCDLIKQENPKK